jgi:AcrR family transcriptional regulator
MPKVSPEHMAARRNQILDAATTCFARHGIHETTIQRICDEAKLSAGALYRHFSDKGDILDAVYVRSIELNRGFGDALAASPDPVATLRAQVSAMIDLLADPDLRAEHQLAVRVHTEALSDPALARRYSAVQRAVVEQVTPLLARLQDEGKVPRTLEPAGFLQVVIATYQGLRIRYLLDPTFDLEQVRAALVALVDQSLGPPK